MNNFNFSRYNNSVVRHLVVSLLPPSPLSFPWQKSQDNGKRWSLGQWCCPFLAPFGTFRYSILRYHRRCNRLSLGSSTPSTSPAPPPTPPLSPEQQSEAMANCVAAGEIISDSSQTGQIFIVYGELLFSSSRPPPWSSPCIVCRCGQGQRFN